jgi:hypothetical protein
MSYEADVTSSNPILYPCMNISKKKKKKSARSTQKKKKKGTILLLGLGIANIVKGISYEKKKKKIT